LEISPVSGHADTVIACLARIAEFLTPYCPDTPRLDAEVLLTHVLQTDRTGLYLAPYRLVSDREKSLLEKLLSRRIQGEPVSYLIGRKEFWSLRFKITPEVMIPRPQTETLVETALQIFPPESAPHILELGTGSGAIAVALATELPGASILATDISSQALSVARDNASAHGVTSISFLEGDLYKPLRDEKKTFDLIISNPPYISSADIPRLPGGIRDYEPHSALDGGSDGLDFYRRIIAGAHRFLKPGGWLLLEVGDKQSRDVSALISRTGHFSSPGTAKDLLGIERVVKAAKVLKPQ
jgi:release factor glutamine methyltransferase